MTTNRGKSALVIGASSGVGRATVKTLVAEGARVLAVARGAEGLAELRSDVQGGLQTLCADAAEPATAEQLLREHRPQWVVLSAGVRPAVTPFDEQSWEAFSAAWNVDMKAAFHLARAATKVPLAAGSTVVMVSSGAAINGSPLSGGYAGAKRMQWLLAGYAQQVSDSKQLGLRFLAVLPKQLIEGTEIGAIASAAYAARQGVTAAEFMKRYEEPLTSDKVAAAIVGALRGDVPQGVTAIGVAGKGVEAV